MAEWLVRRGASAELEARAMPESQRVWNARHRWRAAKRQARAHWYATAAYRVEAVGEQTRHDNTRQKTAAERAKTRPFTVQLYRTEDKTDEC